MVFHTLAGQHWCLVLGLALGGDIGGLACELPTKSSVDPSGYHTCYVVFNFARYPASPMDVCVYPGCRARCRLSRYVSSYGAIYFSIFYTRDLFEAKHDQGTVKVSPGAGRNLYLHFLCSRGWAVGRGM